MTESYARSVVAQQRSTWRLRVESGLCFNILPWFRCASFWNSISVAKHVWLDGVIGTLRGAGIAQWLERRTRDRRVPGSSPRRSGGIIFFSRVNFLCWLLFRYPFHTLVAANVAKYSGGRLQLITHWCTLHYVCVFEWSDTVNWCMVERCTQNLRRDDSSFTWHQPCNNERALSIHHFGGY